MPKQIFSEEQMPEQSIQPKQEFDEQDVMIEADNLENQANETAWRMNEDLKPSRFWVRLLLLTFVLLGIATLAQSIQWLIDTFNAHQWIYFAFAIGFFIISLTSIGILIQEWRKLVILRKHQQNQQKSRQFLLEENRTESSDEALAFCQSVLKTLHRTPNMAYAKQRWQQQVDQAHNSQEVLYLFSENILMPLDKQVKNLIAKNAAENAVIVAISPLATVDILMVAWRNIALINKITRLYGIELGYVSRLRLFKMVITNMAFAGATEMATDLGTEFFSQNFTAKLSMRAAQGIGVGLLTARLGIKAMEFCRPIAFQPEERPKIAHIRQTLLSSMKKVFFEKKNEEIEKARL